MLGPGRATQGADFPGHTQLTTLPALCFKALKAPCFQPSSASRLLVKPCRYPAKSSFPRQAYLISTGQTRPLAIYSSWSIYVSLRLTTKKKMTLKFQVASRGQGAKTQCLRRLGSNWNLISMRTMGQSPLKHQQTRPHRATTNYR